MEFERPDGGIDWPTVGLAAFFVGLVVLVVALLVVPVVF